MTKQGWLFFLRLPRSRCAPGFKRAWPLCPYNAQTPAFYTSFKSKHGVLHHSCFGQIKVTLLILIFVIIHPARSQIVPLAMSLCILSCSISSYTEPYLCRKRIVSSCILVQLSKAPNFPRSLFYKGIQLAKYFNHRFVVLQLLKVNSKKAHQWPFNSVSFFFEDL